MIQDCVDGLEWCRKNLPSIVSVDIDAFAIGGDSSGGTLATLLGHLASPRPRAVCDVYGPVDLVDMYHARKAKVPDDEWAQRWSDRYTDSHNRAMIADRDPAKAITAAPFGWEINHVPIEQTRARWARPDFEYSPRVFAQTQLKDWMASMGIGLTVLLRLDELEQEEDKLDRCKSWSPYHLLDETYPPTAFFHGEGDGAVPIAASKRMAQRLREQNVDVFESYYPDGPHGFDQELKVGTPWDLADTVGSRYGGMGRVRRARGGVCGSSCERGMSRGSGSCICRAVDVIFSFAVESAIPTGSVADEVLQLSSGKTFLRG
jgi:acetyl esterase/lipase